MKDRTHKRFCSKHQAVHGENTDWWSCRYPNDPERNINKKLWRADPHSLEDW